jgi:hypothetical protein
MAAWDVHRAVVFGRCEPKTGKAAFGRLLDDVMSQEPYRSARRVFWIVDNGSSHHRHGLKQHRSTANDGVEQRAAVQRGDGAERDR